MSPHPTLPIRMRMGFMRGTMMRGTGSGFKKENWNPHQTNCSSLSHSWRRKWPVCSLLTTPMPRATSWGTPSRRSASNKWVFLLQGWSNPHLCDFSCLCVVLSLVTYTHSKLFCTPEPVWVVTCWLSFISESPLTGPAKLHSQTSVYSLVLRPSPQNSTRNELQIYCSVYTVVASHELYLSSIHDA